MSRSIALSGMMGAGKTTVGALVAARLGRRLVDVDAEVEGHLGKSIAQVVADIGIEEFRMFEHQVIRQVFQHPDLVVSLGGGAVLDDHNVAELLLTGVLVHLDAPAEVLVDRLVGDADQVGARPLLAGDDPAAEVRRLHAERDARYRDVADVVVDATGDPAEVCEEVLAWARGAGDVLTPSEHEVTM
jgi:shikimate kinase